MSGNGTTGEKISPDYSCLLLTEEDFLRQLDNLRDRYRLLGPVDRNGRAVYRETESAAGLNLGVRTMIPPAKAFFFKARQKLVHFDMQAGSATAQAPQTPAPALLTGILPCDVHSLLYLDNVFGRDPHYHEVRENTIILAYNCLHPSQYCFCSSAGTGPFLGAVSGCDAVLTRLEEGFLFEPLSERGDKLLTGASPDERHWREKKELEQRVRSTITKRIEMNGLEEILLRNLNHPVWSRTADERCLSCTNCVMVCPTCFCHDVKDRVDMGLQTAERYRQWDACQDMGFAEVHGGNFRQTRAARLRQFVMHKLDYRNQYGQPGTVGCGRCIEWCPTSIDLTEMAIEIQKDYDE